MAFRLHKEIEHNLKDILAEKSVIKTHFDLFYLCLLIGLASGTKATDDLKGRVFIDHFVEDFRVVKHLLIGLLIMSELRFYGIEMTNKLQVRKEICRIIDPEGTDYLTPHGIDLLNKYAGGGYEFMLEHEFKATVIHDFLREYVELVDLAVIRGQGREENKRVDF